MKKYDKIIYVSDKVINFKFLDLIDKFNIVEDILVVILKENIIHSVYKKFNIIQDINFFEENNAKGNELFILDCENNNYIVSKYLNNVSTSNIILLGNYFDECYRKVSKCPVILISGFSSDYLQFDLSLKLQKNLEEIGETPMIISNYEYCEVFGAKNLKNIISEIKSNNIFGINDEYNQIYSKLENSIVIININKCDEIITKRSNYIEDFYISELIKYFNIDYFINFSPINFIDLKDDNEKFFLNKFGFSVDYYLYSKEIITNLSIETKYLNSDDVFVKISNDDKLPKICFENVINYYNERSIDDILFKIQEKIGINKSIRKV